MVYVLNIDGRPLMPTERHWHVRRLLRDGKAVVVKRMPFTIRLTYETENGTQPVSLGVDCGTAHIGLSACSEKKELFAAEVLLRTDIVKKLSDRREQRRTRRNRLRYRKARFLNRVSTKKQGWLAPSVRHKVECHKEMIRKVYDILPVTEIHVEVASFDTQKIKNPNIQGVEYQQGEQWDSYNVREYVLCRDSHKCRNCGGKSKDNVLQVHHLESRKTGGNSPFNLVTLCKTCHENYHKGLITLKLKRTISSLRDAAVMTSMKDKLFDELKMIYPNVQRTYGYITKFNRIKYSVEKSHIADARMISKMFAAKPLGYEYQYTKVRRHNRQLYKLNQLKGGRWKRNQSLYKVFGFRLNDIVEYDSHIGYISGRRNSGYFVVKDTNNIIINNSVSYKKLTFLYASVGYRIIII